MNQSLFGELSLMPNTPAIGREKFPIKEDTTAKMLHGDPYAKEFIGINTI